MCHCARIECKVGCRDSETLQPNAELCTALSMTTFMFDFLLKHRPERPQASDHCHAMLEGALLKLTKLHCTIADVHPWSLESAGALIPCLQMCCSVVEHQTACGASWQHIVARSLRLIDIVLRSPHYSFEEQGVSLRPQVWRQTLNIVRSSQYLIHESQPGA